jgi:hypothetical protein
MDTRALGAATVLDTDGAAVPLAAEWADRPAVVVWLRHFGCVVVIAPGTKVLYRHISRAAGDHAPVSEVLAALAATRAIPVGA